MTDPQREWENRQFPLTFEWTVPRQDMLYELPRPRTLHGMPYDPGAVPALVPVRINDEQELAERTADLERFLANVGTEPPPQPMPPMLPFDFQYELTWRAANRPDDIEPLRMSYGRMVIALHVRGLELQPMSVKGPWHEPGSVPHKWTLQEFAKRVAFSGLDTSHGDGLWLWDDGCDWYIRATPNDLAYDEGWITYLVGPLDDPPDDWEPADRSDFYKGPRYRRAEYILGLLREPFGCLGLANGLPPTADGLP